MTAPRFPPLWLLEDFTRCEKSRAIFRKYMITVGEELCQTVWRSSPARLIKCIKQEGLELNFSASNLGRNYHFEFCCYLVFLPFSSFDWRSLVLNITAFEKKNAVLYKFLTETYTMKIIRFVWVIHFVSLLISLVL